jgi:hypothetical protein
MVELAYTIAHNGFGSYRTIVMHPSLELFTPLLGTDFTVETQAGPVVLRLEGCTEAPRRGLPEQFRAPLSLIFSGPRQPILAQDNFAVEHPVLAHQVWCIAPVMPPLPGTQGSVATPPDRQRYQVLFA